MPEVFTVLVAGNGDAASIYPDGSYSLCGSVYCSVLMESGQATTRRLLRLGGWMPAPPPIPGHPGPFNRVRGERCP